MKKRKRGRRPDNTMSQRRLLCALAIKKLENQRIYATGAAIADVIATHTNGNYPQLRSTIYGIMNGLKDRGWATNYIEDEKYKTWALTPAGGRALQRTLAEFDSLRASVSARQAAKVVKLQKAAA